MNTPKYSIWQGRGIFRGAAGRRAASMCLAGLCLVWTATAQSELQQKAMLDTTGLPPQPIGINDLLNVTVYGVPNLSRPLRVTQSGDITVPMVSRPIRAEGRLPQDLEPVIAKAYEDAGVLVDPVITVTVTEYRSRPITVSGAVKNPLTFQAVGRVTLLDAIAKANGLTPEAGSEILILNHEQSSSEAAAKAPIHVSAQGLMSGSEADANLTLSGGEDIRVPVCGKVFVLGNVKKPGAFRAEDPLDTSVLRLLALSEGLTPFASKVAYIYRTEPKTMARAEIPVELRQILDRKQPDVALQANDILYVPDNRKRRALSTTLERILTFGAGTASGVIIWH